MYNKHIETRGLMSHLQPPQVRPHTPTPASQVTEISKTRGQPNSVAILINEIYVSCPNSSIPQTLNFAKCPPSFYFPPPRFLSARVLCPTVSTGSSWALLLPAEATANLSEALDHYRGAHPETDMLGKAAMEKQTGLLLTAICSATFSNAIKC